MAPGRRGVEHPVWSVAMAVLIAAGFVDVAAIGQQLRRLFDR
jgi:hypothetical protein